MKLDELLTEQDYNIIKVQREDDSVTGTSKQGTIKANYHDLVKLFGKPKNFTREEKSDVNFEWNISVDFKKSNEDDHDTVDVAIYDYRRGENSRQVDPTTISDWTVGAKTKEGLWVLMDLLKGKK